MQPHMYCHYCGTQRKSEKWPRTCGACGQVTYRNPLPVVVTLVPMPGGILGVRRNNEPGKGKLALPGGHLEFGETWQQCAARELAEETGFELHPNLFTFYSVEDALISGFLVVFCKTQHIVRDLKWFKPNKEVSALELLTRPMELAFPTHTKMLARWFMELTL
jgi:ADP-ribose pyrophosphatase YjhB (NUDIX family)